MNENVKLFLSSIFSFFGVIFKSYYLITLSILVFFTLDYFTKFLCMKISGEKWDNVKASNGFWTKILYLIGFGIGCFFDFIIPSLVYLGYETEFSTHGLIGVFCGMYIIFNEIGSIKRNCDSVNIKILPNFIYVMIDKITEFLNNGGK